MAVCTFLGHETMYEEDLPGRIQRAVDAVIEKYETVDFWFWRPGPFYAQCHMAVMRAKQRCPDKRITVSVVMDRAACQAFMAQTEPAYAQMPRGMVDRVIAAPEFTAAQGGTHALTIGKKINRWVMRKAACVIAYLYEALHAPEQGLYGAAQRAGARMVDVTAPETAAFFEQCIERLDGTEKQIFEGYRQRRTLGQIGAALGVSGTRIQQMTRTVCVQWMQAALACRRSMNETGGMGAPACSVFGMGEATYWSMAALEQAARYLVRQFGVQVFYVPAQECSCGYLYVLRAVTQWHDGVQIVAVTQGQADPAQTARCCPPCSRVERAGCKGRETADAGRWMIQRSAFCICQTASDAGDETMRGDWERGDAPILIDISPAAWYERQIALEKMDE